MQFNMEKFKIIIVGTRFKLLFFYKYLQIKQSKLNMEKSKFIIVGIRYKFLFIYKDLKIEQVKNYKYLHIEFSNDYSWMH